MILLDGEEKEDGMPLYLSIDEAAEYAGIGQKTMREYANSSDPPPYLRIGSTKKIQASALEAYLERKQEVRCR